MPDAVLWVKLRSWHVIASKGTATRCGRWYAIPSPTAGDLPMGERSCESCLRLVAHDQERASA